MEARELRIGNWVIMIYAPYGHAQDSSYQRIDINDLRAIEKRDPSSSFRYEPIPISPSILEKAGAIKGNRDWDYTISVGALKMHFRRFADTWYSELGEIYLGDRIQYVHQLQNIYHSIHGTELTLNL